MTSISDSAGQRGLRAYLRQRFNDWANRRIPRARSITLDQKRLFIFPSRVGLFFGLALLVMLLLSINYENNMGYAVTFLLATLFVIAILHTFANLSGLTVHAIGARPAFPGQQTEFEIMIERGKRRDHFALHSKWSENAEAVVNLVDEDSVRIHLHQEVGERGWYNPGRLLIDSTYPLGLIRCWTWVDLELYAMVYPQPLASPELPGLATDEPDGASVPVPGSDDFYGFRNYREGDSPRHIHWKGLAKGQVVQSKQYSAYADRSVWLDWDMFPGLGTEQRLSHLCYWALEFERSDEEYGLRIPGVVIEPGVGEKQRDEVLKALALYGLERRPAGET